jgi:hypothetical protein
LNRKLIALNLALLALLGLLGWQLRRKYRQARARETAMLGQGIGAASVAAPAALRKIGPLDAAAYQDTVAKNLFSADRNPNPIPDPPPAPPPPPPVPPFPVARGVMLWEGVPPTIVLAKKGSSEQHGYHPGDSFEQWKIVSLDHEYLVLEWNGQEFKKRLDELMDRTPIAANEPPPPPQNTTPAPAKAATSLSESKNGMGADMGGARACVAGDTQPAGAVVDGMKKVVSATPFGSVCRWEPAQ